MATTLPTVTVTGQRPQNYSISKLRQSLGRLVRPNNFRVKLNMASTSGRADQPQISTIASTFEFRCERAELPGRTLATSDDMGSGPSLKIPYDTTYNDIQLSVICAEDMAERKFFEKWMDFIVKPGDSPQAGTLAFYSDYALGNTLQVSQLNDDGEAVLTYTCYHVYPIAITPMNATWEEINTYQRFSVTLCYRYHQFN
jgi:hypothetical protein